MPMYCVIFILKDLIKYLLLILWTRSEINCSDVNHFSNIDECSALLFLQNTVINRRLEGMFENGNVIEVVAMPWLFQTYD